MFTDRIWQLTENFCQLLSGARLPSRPKLALPLCDESKRASGDTPRRKGARFARGTKIGE